MASKKILVAVGLTAVIYFTISGQQSISREQFKVAVPTGAVPVSAPAFKAPGKINSWTREPLNGAVTSFDASKLQGRTGFLPGIMTRTEPVKGGVSADIVKADVYQAWLQKAHPNLSVTLSKFSRQSIIVVKGQWDNSAKTLDKYGFAHTRISGSQFNGVDLASARIVIVDCGAQLNQAAKQKLRQFVSNGGYLLSTDWDLDGFLSSTFMNYVVWNKGVNKSLIYDATVVDADPILFKNTVTNAPWKLDQESHLVGVRDTSRVRILIESSILKKEDPDRVGALAVVFKFGRGYVLHMAGHFDNNSGIPIKHRLPDPAPVIGLSLRQALATNFLAAALSGQKIPMR